MMKKRLVLSVFIVLYLVLGIAPQAAKDQEKEPSFTITKIEPVVEQDQVKIDFSEPVDINRLKNSLQIIPPTRISWRESQMEGEKTLRLQGQFRHDTNYRISILRGVKSRNGRLYQPTLTEFVFPNPPSSIRPVTGRNVIERDSRQLAYFQIRNVESFYISLTKIPPIQLGLMKNREFSMQDELEGLEREYLELKERFGNEPQLADFFRAPRDSRQLLFPQVKKNKMERFAAPLTFRDQPQTGSVELLSHKMPNASWVQGPVVRITDLGLTFKKTKSHLLVWVTSLRTGRPLEGVKIAGTGEEPQLLYLGETDEEGILDVSPNSPVKQFDLNPKSIGKNIKDVTPSIADITSLLAVTESDYTYIDTSVRQTRQSSKRGRVPQADFSGNIAIPEELKYQAEEKKGEIFTERGIYRPGETVYFKGVVREIDPDTNTIALPKGEKCQIIIYDPRGNEIYKKELQYSHFGSVNDSVSIRPFAKLGTYNLQMKIDESTVFYTTFQVQEFRQPRHYVDVSFKHLTREIDNYINIEKTKQHMLKFTISGTYYLGGPVKNGKAQWQIYTTSSDLQAKGYNEYTFGADNSYEQHFLEAGESVLDESGEISVTIPIDEGVLSGLHGIKIIATVLDFDGRSALTTDTYRAEPDYLVGIEKHKRQVSLKEPQAVSIVVLDPQRRPVKKGEVLIETYRRGRYYHRKREADGDLYWRWDENWEKQGAVKVPIEGGDAIFEFAFDQPGEHLIRVHFTDKAGETYTSGSRFLVRYPGGYYGPLESLRTIERAEVAPDREKYSIGDDIRVFVGSEFKAQKALVTVELDDIHEYHVLDLVDNEFTIEAKPEYEPNVYISVIGVKGRGDFPVYPGEYDDEAPNLFYGVTNVKIEKQINELSIEIAPDKDQIESLPGEEITLDFQVLDQQGDGVYSELAIAVVDEQILALTAFETPDLSNLAELIFPLNVGTGDLRRELQYQTPFGRFANLPVTGGDGMEGGPRIMDVKYREDYRPVAFWDAEIRTDDSGRTSISFRFPDTMTQYRIYAVACDKGKRFASAERKATVVKPFYFEPGLPAFLNVGDDFSFKLSAFNKTSREESLSFEINSSEPLSLTAEKKTAEIGSYDRVLVPVDGKALAPGEAEVRVLGQLGENQDAMKVTLPVKSGYLIDHDFQFGHASKSHQISYQFPKGTEDLLLGTLDKTELAAQLTVAIDLPLLQIRPGLKYLLRYPYGCIEQTSSGIIPLAALRDLIRKNYLPGIDVLEADKFIGRGIDQILSMQVNDGGFGYWPGYQLSSLWASLYAMTALTFARDAGYDVPESNFNQGMQYLQQQRNTEEKWRDATSQGLAVFVLAKGDGLTKDFYNQQKRDYKRLNDQGKLLMLMAGKMKGYEPEEFVHKQAAELLNNPEKPALRYHYNARHRGDAVRLMAANMIFPTSPEVDDMAGALLRKMKPDGRYTSTSDTGWALMALSQYLERSVIGQGSTKGVVVIGDQKVASFELASGSWEVFHLDAENFINHPTAEVILDNDRTFFYELDVTYPRVDYAKSGYSNGFNIQKTIRNTNGEDTIRVGDVVEVEVTISTDSKGYEDIMLDDPLPAGLSAINPVLATEAPAAPDTRTGEDWYFQYWNPVGYYNFYPNHVEMKNDRVTAFRESIWSGEYRYSYYARAITAGDFRVPSSKVQLMYEPDTKAFTKEMSVRIDEQ